MGFSQSSYLVRADTTIAMSTITPDTTVVMSTQDVTPDTTQDVTQYLRGKVVTIPQDKEDQWTPYNSNMNMQGIKVYVQDPVPSPTTDTMDSVETGLDILRTIIQQKNKEKEDKKEQRIK